jgi:hypothetical protein
MTTAPETMQSDARIEPPGNWQAIVGKWKNGVRCQYDGPVPEENGHGAVGLFLNAKRLKDGTICVKVKLSRNEATSAGVFLGFSSRNKSFVVAALGAFNRAFSIFQFVPGLGFTSLADGGHISNLNPDDEHALKVSFIGQRVQSQVNDVDVLETVVPTPMEGFGWGLYAYDRAPVSFADISIQRRAPKLFVVMPFKEPFDTLYNDVIEPVATNDPLVFDVTRIDEIYAPGVILEDIRRQIEEAHVIVAEISTSNPNVFYELGYAHALRKPVVLLARRGPDAKLPFDISSYRVIFYDDSIGGKKLVEEQLRRHLEAVLRDR